MTAEKKRTSGTTLDDRGETRAVVRVADLYADPRMKDPAFAAVCERVMRLKTSTLNMTRVVLLAAAAGLVFGLCTVFARRVFGFVPPVWLGGVVMGVGTSAVTILLMRLGEKKRAPEVARILLADGVCPSCSYTLADIPPEQDGCIVCPECGGAWREDRMIRRVRFMESMKDSPRLRGLAALWRDGIGTGATRVTDDAGEVRPLVSGRLRREIAGAVGTRRERLRTAAKRNARSGVLVRVVIGGFYLLVGVGLAWTAARTLRSNALALAAAGVGVLCVIFGISFLRGSAGTAAKWVRREMLKQRLCPSCAADLPVKAAEPLDNESSAAISTESPSGSILLVPCAECGAKWRAREGSLQRG